MYVGSGHVSISDSVGGVKTIAKEKVPFLDMIRFSFFTTVLSEPIVLMARIRTIVQLQTVVRR